MNDHLTSYKKTVMTDEKKDILVRFDLAWPKYIASVKRLMPLAYANNTEEAMLLMNGEVSENFKIADTILTDLVNINKDTAKLDYDNSDAIVANITTILIIIIVIGVALSLIIGFALINSITTPMKKLMKMVLKISEGDFSHAEEVKVKSLDEIGVLAKASNKMLDGLKRVVEVFKRMADGDIDVSYKTESDKDELGIAINKMIDALNELLLQVNIAVQLVATGSNQVSQASQALSPAASEQASALEEITSSINELSSQTMQNTTNATQVNGLAKTAKDNAEQGNNQMKNLIAAMNEINKSSDKIKKVVKIIDNIAFQINLLALNANVEAARAGKYGKGFAVVADEVRNLAVRSAEAVKETTHMVEDSLNNITKGNSLVDLTAKQLDSIVTGAAKVTDLAEEVAAASKEQAQGLEQINNGLGQIDQVTQSNTASAEECASASEELASQAQQLKEMITKFKMRQKATGTIDTQNLNPEMLDLIRKEISKSQEHQTQTSALQHINRKKKETLA